MTSPEIQISKGKLSANDSPLPPAPKARVIILQPRESFDLSKWQPSGLAHFWMSRKSVLPPAIFCRGWSLKGQIEGKQPKESVAEGGGKGKGYFEGQSQAEGLWWPGFCGVDGTGRCQRFPGVLPIPV